jgi:hypothetical protein
MDYNGPIIEIRAKRLENGWFVEVVKQIAYNGIQTKGYIYQGYTEMLQSLIHDYLNGKEV